jgi:hypothetical protein
MFDNMDGFENLHVSSKILNYIVRRKTVQTFSKVGGNGEFCNMNGPAVHTALPASTQEK